MSYLTQNKSEVSIKVNLEPDPESPARFTSLRSATSESKINMRFFVDLETIEKLSEKR